MRLRSTVGAGAPLIADRLGDNAGVSADTVQLSPGDGQIDPLIVAAFDLNDPYSVNVRALRTRIIQRYAERDDRRIRSCGLIGFDCDEELAVLAANLAVVVARTRTPTLLLDGNDRSPRIDQFFQPFETTETSATAVGATATVIPRLWIVPAAGSAAPSEHHPIMERVRGWTLPATQLIATLALDRDTSAGSIASTAVGLDVAVLVVRRHVSTVAEVRGVIDSFDEHGVEIAGAVLV